MPLLINPEIAAHNIATAYCEHEINKLNAEFFEIGDLNTSSSAKTIWKLYATIYDSVFEAATEDNALSMQEV